MRSFDPSFYRMSRTPNPSYNCGASCSLVRVCGNAHGKVANCVACFGPSWELGRLLRFSGQIGDLLGEGFTWFKGVEVADASLLFLFQNSPDDVNVSTLDWKTHAFACRTIVTELWLPEDVRPKKSLFSLLRAREQAPRRFFTRYRRCDYGGNCKFKHIQ
jgi:hypothetical protein